MNAQKILFTALSTEELSKIMEASVRNAIGNYEISKPGEDQLLNARQAAKLINYRRPTLYGLVKQHKIPFSKTAGKLLFSRNKLLEWVANGKQSSATKSPQNE